jgi:hypothetical protein
MTTIPLITAQLGSAHVSEQVTQPWWTKPATAAAPDHQKVRSQYRWTSGRRRNAQPSPSVTSPRTRSVRAGAGSQSIPRR